MELDVSFVSKLITLFSVMLILAFVIWNLVYSISQKIDILNNIFNGINMIFADGLLFIGEMKRKYIENSFSFVCNQFGRGLFCFFLCGWVLAINGQTQKNTTIHQFGLSTGIILGFVGGIYIASHFIFEKRQQQQN